MSKAAKDKTSLWVIGSGDLSAAVRASNQFEALDAFRRKPIGKFGLIAVAESNEDADPYPVRTSILMRRWGRVSDAKLFAAAMENQGMPDTTNADRKAAKHSLAVQPLKGGSR